MPAEERPADRKRRRLLNLIQIQDEMKRRQAERDPITYGLPDLMSLFPAPGQDPKDPDLVLRQEAAIGLFIEENLKSIEKDGKRRVLKSIRQQRTFIAAIFFERIQRVIAWKARGCGGSLAAAIAVWLCQVYQKTSWLDMAGCLLPGALVWTDQGLKPVEEVVPGDLVHGLEGSRAVETVTEKAWVDGEQVWFRAHGFGAGIHVTPDHRFWTVRNVVHPAKLSNSSFDTNDWEDKGEWVAAEDLTRSDVLQIPRPIYDPGLSPAGPFVVKARNGKGAPVEEQWSEELGRFVGYWLAEGSTYQCTTSQGCTYYGVRFDVSTEDVWLDELRGLIASLFNRSATYDEPSPGNTKEACVRFSSQGVHKWLKVTFGATSYAKRIPLDLIDSLPDSILESILIGWLRGDGGLLTTSRGAFDVSGYTGSAALAAAIYRISLRLGYVPNMTIVRPDQKRSGFGQGNRAQGYQLSWGSVDADALIEKAFGWATQKERTPRARRCWATKKHVYLGIKEVCRSSYSGPVYDLGVHENPSFLTMAGVAHNSQEQALAVYQYTKQFWAKFPRLKAALLDGEPLATETRLKGGSILKCVPTSEKQIRSKHLRGLLADESCQEREDADKIIHAAINGAMSEEDHIIILLSTFHWPVGIFQETWDGAKDKGYMKVKWNVFDAMQKCTQPIDCRKDCPLTWQEQEEKGDGTVKIVWKGCDGQARTSEGWLSYDHVCKIQKTNVGTEIFQVEFCNERPRFKAQIYNPDLIDLAAELDVPDIPPVPQPLVDHRGNLVPVEDSAKFAIGLDWGLASMLAVVLTMMVDKTWWVMDLAAYQGKLTPVVAEKIRQWQAMTGRRIPVFPDGSHPFNNQELAAEFDVHPVFFSIAKEWGIRNVNQWLAAGKLRIPAKFTLLTGQMKQLRRNKAGNVIKRDDHAPDALLCAGCAFPYQVVHDTKGDSEDDGVSVTMFGSDGEIVKTLEEA